MVMLMVMVEFRYEWWSYVTGVFPYDWKKGNIIPVHKKNSKQIVYNYRSVSFSPFALKSLKNWSLRVSLISPIKITFSTATNQDSDLMTLAYISLLQLHITFLVLSMLTLHWKFVAFSLIYLKYLIEFGMMVTFINSRVMELTVTSLNFKFIFKQQMPAGCSQWSIFSLEIGYRWYAARFSSRSIIFFSFTRMAFL